jgi:hypothetical protein
MSRFAPAAAEGYYIATTSQEDNKTILDFDVNSVEFKEFLIRLQQRLNNLALYQNNKVAGIFSLDEQINGKQYFQTNQAAGTGQQSQIQRQVYHKTFNVGSLLFPGPTIIPTDLDISADWIATDIYGTATEPGVRMIPLPFSSPVLNENIKLEVVGTNIVITTVIDYSAFTHTYVTLEYVKSS